MNEQFLYTDVVEVTVEVAAAVVCEKKGHMSNMSTGNKDSLLLTVVGEVVGGTVDVAAIVCTHEISQRRDKRKKGRGLCRSVLCYCLSAALFVSHSHHVCLSLSVSLVILSVSRLCYTLSVSHTVVGATVVVVVAIA